MNNNYAKLITIFAVLSVSSVPVLAFWLQWDPVVDVIEEGPGNRYNSWDSEGLWQGVVSWAEASSGSQWWALAAVVLRNTLTVNGVGEGNQVTVNALYAVQVKRFTYGSGTFNADAYADAFGQANSVSVYIQVDETDQRGSECLTAWCEESIPLKNGGRYEFELASWADAVVWSGQRTYAYSYANAVVDLWLFEE